MVSQPGKPKFIRDPIHDIIRIKSDDQFILRLLDSAPMQRLRRIGQLGLAQLVYPGAEHSRFTHSLGVFHLAGRVMAQLEEEAGEKLFEGHRQAVLAAALLHDIGHGPFSHIFEKVSKNIGSGPEASHEAWTVRIIRESEEIQTILNSVSLGLTDLVCQILNHTYKPHYVTAMVSSQLDVDRFDYLLRDSHMTGTHYGDFDLQWMLRTLAVKEVSTTPGGATDETAQFKTIVVDGQRGLSGLEEYLLGRHYMYRHVYYHKAIRSAERTLDVTLKRAAELVQQGNDSLGNSAFVKMAKGDALSVSDYLSLNDFTLMTWIQGWAQPGVDKTLGDLSNRLVNRNLLKALLVPPESGGKAYADNREQLAEFLRSHNYDPKYYLLEDSVDNVAYTDYLRNLERGKVADEEEIWFIGGEDKPTRLSACDASIIVSAAKSLHFHEERWFVPDEVAKDVQNQLRWK